MNRILADRLIARFRCQVLDLWMARREKKSLPCTVGCDACCEGVVIVLRAEAQFILARAEHRDARASGSGACPYRVGGACSIYSIRPSTCVLYASRRRAACYAEADCESHLDWAMISEGRRWRSELASKLEALGADVSVVDFRSEVPALGDCGSEDPPSTQLG